VRVIAGSFRSRTLEAPAGLDTRPTSDRLRETLFNVLAACIPSQPAGAAFLDLYAGSGAVGIEALSRGAARVEFVERAPAALKVLRGNLEKLGLRRPETTAGFRIYPASVGAFLRRAAAAASNEVAPKTEGDEGGNPRVKPIESVEALATEEFRPISAKLFLKQNVIFLDPPWDAAEEYAATLGLLGGPALDLLAAEAVVIAEHRKKQCLEDRYGSLERTRLLKQGDAALSFYAVAG
jgi:16S rRNA G966 N2-methylase RsmD